MRSRHNQDTLRPSCDNNRLNTSAFLSFFKASTAAGRAGTAVRTGWILTPAYLWCLFHQRRRHSPTFTQKHIYLGTYLPTRKCKTNSNSNYPECSGLALQAKTTEYIIYLARVGAGMRKTSAELGVTVTINRQVAPVVQKRFQLVRYVSVSVPISVCDAFKFLSSRWLLSTHRRRNGHRESLLATCKLKLHCYTSYNTVGLYMVYVCICKYIG